MCISGGVVVEGSHTGSRKHARPISRPHIVEGEGGPSQESLESGVIQEKPGFS